MSRMTEADSKREQIENLFHRRPTGRRSSEPLPTLHFERQLWSGGHEVVAGVDEVGRGAWAGPLVAAAVALPRDGRERARLTRVLNRAGVDIRDSKQLTPSQRERARDIALEFGLNAAVAEVCVAELDDVGLAEANRAALARAAAALDPRPSFVLVDAFRLRDLACGHEAIAGGDACCTTIALASIIAKVHRDALMRRLHEDFPGYGFCDHKGYGTPRHAEAIAQHGVTAHHRRSFAPVARAIAGDDEPA
jgi:ribonuclease HII